MAFIQGQQDEDELLNGQQGQGQTPLVGGNSNAISQGGAPTAGVGAGGAGGWTNIQAYLNANQGDTGSAGALERKVGGAFSKERENMTSKSGQFLQDAQKYSDDNSLNQGKVDDITKRATEMYDWGDQAQQPVQGGEKSLDPYAPDGGGEIKQEKVVADPGSGPLEGNTENVDANASYEDLVGQIQKGLTSQYGGAREYNYGLGAETQEYGANLADSGGFDQLMGHIYADAAGRPMTAGQNALQRQLDVNNVGLADSRKRLGDQYAQLGKDRDQLVADTTKSLGGIEQAYYDNQAAMRDYLSGKANALNTQISQDEANARAAYNQEFESGVSDAQTLQEYLNQALYDSNNTYSRSRDNIGNYVNPRDNGIAGQNWQDLQRMLDGSSYINDTNLRELLTSGLAAGTPIFDQGQYDTVMGAEGSYKNMVEQELKKFYEAQQDKYKDLDNEQRGAYNVLQDFLNGNDKKTKGFDVRA